MNLLTVSGSPHVKGDLSLKQIMWGVVVALIPSMLVSFWYFGLAAIIITLASVASCLVFEYTIQKYLLKIEPSITDGSAVITGLLLAFNVPSGLPIWQIIIGALISIGVAKLTYGGLGKNPFNPALVGRVFLLISFPVDMTTWTKPTPPGVLVDAITGPTALGILKEGLVKGETISKITSQLPSYMDMFIGQIGGSLGEVSALAIIIGGIYLLMKRIITWHIPVAYIGSVLIFTGILWLINPELYINPIFHLLAGGLMLGAIFMATDMVTSPMTPVGMLVFGLGCGILTVLIRIWGAYPEGVSFAILIMNAVTPLINKGFKPKKFGKIIYDTYQKGGRNELV